MECERQGEEALIQKKNTRTWRTYTQKMTLSYLRVITNGKKKATKWNLKLG